MGSYEFLLLLHILLFVYWLGGDLGVFYASSYVVKPDLPPPTRAVVAKIMMALDLVPRICLVLMFPAGLGLSWLVGVLVLPGWVVPAAWGLGLAWLALVVTIFRKEHAPVAVLLTRIDWGVRLAVVAVIAWMALSSLGGNGPVVGGDWVAAKMLVFCGIILCGLAIRVALRPFTQAFGQLMRDGSSPAVEADLARALSLVRPFVLMIWAGLVVNAWLGIAKPL